MSGYFWVDDGHSLLDNDSDCRGLRVDLSDVGGFLPQPLPPDFCAVTGVMRCMIVDTPNGPRNVRVLVPFRPDQIVRYILP